MYIPQPIYFSRCGNTRLFYKCKRAKDNKQPEQQMALPEGSSVTVFELHGVGIKSRSTT